MTNSRRLSATNGQILAPSGDELDEIIQNLAKALEAILPSKAKICVDEAKPAVASQPVVNLDSIIDNIKKACDQPETEITDPNPFIDRLSERRTSARRSFRNLGFLAEPEKTLTTELKKLQSETTEPQRLSILTEANTATNPFRAGSVRHSSKTRRSAHDPFEPEAQPVSSLETELRKVKGANTTLTLTLQGENFTLTRGNDTVTLQASASNGSLPDLSITVNTPPGKAAKTMKIMAMFGLLLSAGVEAADVTTSLITAKRSYLVVFLASSIAFLAQFGLTGKPVQDAVKELSDIVKFKSLPTQKNRKLAAANEDWPDLPPNDELKAVVIGTVAALWGSYSKGSLAYYLMNTIPGDYAFATSWVWTSAAAVFAAGFIATGLLTESFEFYKFMRQRLAGKQTNSVNAYARKIALGLGGTFAIVNALSDSAGAIQGITNTWKIPASTLGYWLTAVPSLMLDGGQKLIFEGRQLINGVENSLNYANDILHSREKLTLSTSLIFLIVIGLPAFLEICKLAINRGFYDDVLTDVFDNVVSLAFLLSLAKVFSYLGVNGGTLIGAVSLYPEVKPVVEVTAEKLSAAKKTLVDTCQANEEKDPEAVVPLLIEDPRDDESDVLTLNSIGLDSTRQPTPAKKRFCGLFDRGIQPDTRLEVLDARSASWCSIS